VLLFVILAGLLSLLVSIWLDSPGLFGTLLTGPDGKSHAASFVGKLFEHFGVALLIAAFVGVMFESERYSKYFLQRLANTIVKNEYLAKFSASELEGLQKTLVETRFKLDHIDVEQGFYRYFNRLYQYIASPYREGTRATISIKYSHDGDKRVFDIEDSLSFICRKVGDCTKDELKWNAEKDEIIEMGAFKVTVSIPNDAFKAATFADAHPNLTREAVFDGTNQYEELEQYTAGHGYTLSLKKYSGIDRLHVKVQTSYSSSVDRGLSWTMSDPSQGILLTINHPVDLKIQVDKFGVNPDELTEEPKSGVYTLEYDSWLLPDSGFAFHFLRDEEDNDKRTKSIKPPTG